MNPAGEALVQRGMPQEGLPYVGANTFVLITAPAAAAVVAAVIALARQRAKKAVALILNQPEH